MFLLFFSLTSLWSSYSLALVFTSLLNTNFDFDLMNFKSLGIPKSVKLFFTSSDQSPALPCTHWTMNFFSNISSFSNFNM